MQSEEQRGDAAYQRRESAKRRRQWTIQLVVLVVLVAFVWLLVHNVSSNLAERSIRSGFDFLKGAANFEIGEVLLPFDSSQPVWLAFLNGVLNTIRVAVFAIITSMVLGPLWASCVCPITRFCVFWGRRTLRCIAIFRSSFSFLRCTCSSPNCCRQVLAVACGILGAALESGLAVCRAGPNGAGCDGSVHRRRFDGAFGT